MQWPEHLPSACPPADAQPASGVVFRLIRGATPSPGDFLPKCLENPAGDFTGRECLAAGLSVYRKRRDLDRLLTYPTFRKDNWRIARGDLHPQVGRLKATPPQKIRNSHHTWWWPSGVEPSTLFRLDEGSLDPTTVTS